MDLVLVKLGGSVITDKMMPMFVKEDVLAHLVYEIAEVWKGKRDFSILLGHGSGSFGHYAAQKYQTHLGLVDGENSKVAASEVQHMARRLHQTVLEKLMGSFLPVVGITPSSIMKIRSDESVAYFENTVPDFLNSGFLPVVYGDVAFHESNGVGILSTERIFDALLHQWEGSDIKVKKIIMVGDTDGIYDQNGEIYEEITQASVSEVKKNIETPEGMDITGGMDHKLDLALEWADRGIETYLVNGKVEGRVRKALMGEETMGTRVIS